MRPMGSACTRRWGPVVITRTALVMPILWASKVGIWSYFAYSFFYLTEFCTLLESTDLLSMKLRTYRLCVRN